MSFLEVKDVYKQHGARVAVDHVNFQMQKGQKIAIAGETGSGKSTLLKIIGGFLQPDSGKVLFENKKVSGPLEKLVPGHHAIAYLSQHFELRNNYAVHELLEMASKIEDSDAQQIFSVCQIEHLLHRRTNELSGGEKQRIVLAMQLIKKPKLLLLDEPFSNLDAIHEQTIKQVIHDVSEAFQTSCIMVSHDGKDVLSWADEIMVMKDGVVVQQATPSVIYHQPVDLYCAGLFGAYNIISSELIELFNLSASEKSACIRPEKIVVAATGIRATVENVMYYGSYDMLQVKILNSVLQIKAVADLYQKNDMLFIQLHQSNVFYC